MAAGVETFHLVRTLRKTWLNIIERWEGFGWGKIGLNCLTIFILWTGVWEGQTDGPFNLRINMLVAEKDESFENLFRSLIFLDGALPGVVRGAGGVGQPAAVLQVPAVRGQAGSVTAAGQLAVLRTDQLVVAALSVDCLTTLIIHRVTGPATRNFVFNFSESLSSHHLKESTISVSRMCLQTWHSVSVTFLAVTWWW